jgi:hypothetical protein
MGNRLNMSNKRAKNIRRRIRQAKRERLEPDEQPTHVGELRGPLYIYESASSLPPAEILELAGIDLASKEHICKPEKK